MTKIVQEGVVKFEVMEVTGEDAEDRYRARLFGTDNWWSADSVRHALRGAASTVTDREVEAGLGDLWESDDG